MRKLIVGSCLFLILSFKVQAIIIGIGPFFEIPIKHEMIDRSTSEIYDTRGDFDEGSSVIEAKKRVELSTLQTDMIKHKIPLHIASFFKPDVHVSVERVTVHFSNRLTNIERVEYLVTLNRVCTIKLYYGLKNNNVSFYTSSALESECGEWDGVEKYFRKSLKKEVESIAVSIWDSGFMQVR